jgi:hypothetical protein
MDFFLCLKKGGVFMKFLVVSVLLLTAIAIVVLPKIYSFSMMLRTSQMKDIKRGYIALALIFVSISIVVSYQIGESLGFLNFTAPYSTGAWSTLYTVVFYFFLFHDFELTTFITSKEKKWIQLSDEDLLRFYIIISKDIISNDTQSAEDDENILVGLFESLNLRTAGIVNYSRIEPLEKDDFFDTYEGLFFSTNEERIYLFIISVIDLIRLKQS